MAILNNLLAKLGSVVFYKFMGTDLFRLVLAIVIFTIIMLLRGIFRKFFIKILNKVTVKMIVSMDDIIKELKTPLEVLFIGLAVWIGFYILGLEKVFDAVTRIERIFIIFIITWGIYRSLNLVICLLKKLTEETETKLDNYLVVFAGNTVKTIVMIVGLVMVLQELGYNVTSIIAGLGIGGLAFALASKDFVANIFGFFTIFMDKPFTVGDWISTPDVEGTVEDIWLRCTKVRTFEQALVTIPNSVLAAKPIVNRSIMRKRLITFKLGITYSSKAGQIEELCRMLRKMLGNHPDINKEIIYVYFTEFADSSYNLFLYFFTNTTLWKEYLDVQQDINLKIMKILEELDIEVAFPSRSIYIENLPLDVKTLYKTGNT